MSIQTQSSGAVSSTAPALARAIYALVRLASALSVLAILVALGFTLIAVFWRYALSNPLLWPEDATGWTLVGLIMLGIAEAYRRGDHIAIDLLVDTMPHRLKPVQMLWSHLAVLAFSVVLGLSAWEAVHFAHGFGSYTSGNVEIPSWIPQAPMVVGAVLLGLTAVAKIIEILFGKRPA